MTNLSEFHLRALDRTRPTVTKPGFGRDVKVPKAAELVARDLRRRIVRGELKPGDAFPSETQMMDAYRVSRPTLREALRVLESERLITILRGARGGARVQLPDIDVAARYVGLVLEHRGASLADVFAARELIELEAVKLVTAKHSRADLEALKIRHEELLVQFSEDVVSWSANALTFHQLIVELCRNETLTVLNGLVTSILNKATTKRAQDAIDSAEYDARTTRARRDHAHLLVLIDGKDVDGAVEWWRKHCRLNAHEIVSGAGNDVLDIMD